MSASAPSTPQVSATNNTPKPVAALAQSNNASPGNTPLRMREALLPMNRVKTIMKSSPDVDNIGQESLFLVTKATELFIMYLTKLSQRNNNDQEVTYSDLAAIVARKNSMEFLQDILPKKIKYSEYLEIMEKENTEDTGIF